MTVEAARDRGNILYFLPTVAIHVAEWEPFFRHLGQQCLYVHKGQSCEKFFDIEHAGI